MTAPKVFPSMQPGEGWECASIHVAMLRDWIRTLTILAKEDDRPGVVERLHEVARHLQAEAQGIEARWKPAQKGEGE